MSHAYGEVIVNRAVVAYFEYNGTSDVAQPKLYATRDDLEADWRQG